MSVTPFVSPTTRFEAFDSNATNLPSALMAGESVNAAVASVPSLATLGYAAHSGCSDVSAIDVRDRRAFWPERASLAVSSQMCSQSGQR